MNRDGSISAHATRHIHTYSYIHDTRHPYSNCLLSSYSGTWGWIHHLQLCSNDVHVHPFIHSSYALQLSSIYISILNLSTPTRLHTYNHNTHSQLYWHWHTHTHTSQRLKFTYWYCSLLSDFLPICLSVYKQASSSPFPFPTRKQYLNSLVPISLPQSFIDQTSPISYPQT